MGGRVGVALVACVTCGVGREKPARLVADIFSTSAVSATASSRCSRLLGSGLHRVR